MIKFIDFHGDELPNSTLLCSHTEMNLQKKMKNMRDYFVDP